MPELPEVETVRRGLEPVMTGQRITCATVNRPDLRWPLPDQMAERLTGASVLQLRRRSKYILADLDTKETLLIHLGMSGRMLISGSVLGRFAQTHSAPQKHDHVILDMSGGARITFNDPRRFGAMDLIYSGDTDDHWLLKTLGPEPYDNTYSPAYLIGALKTKRSPIKSALLDQRVVAGLGNIYVCEALWRAGISPKRQAAKISAERITTLAQMIRETLDDAIAAGGSSLRDYRQADGALGYFQHSFAVYGREGAPCKTPGCIGEIRREVQSGRSSFYCLQCQR